MIKNSISSYSLSECIIEHLGLFLILIMKVDQENDEYFEKFFNDLYIDKSNIRYAQGRKREYVPVDKTNIWSVVNDS